MKITGVKTTLYLYKTDRRLGDANSPSGRTQAASCLVELETDAALTGIAIGGGGVRPQICGLVDSLLVGQDPRRVQGLWKRMVDKHFKGGHDGLINDAISVLDIALWDLKAKANNEPLWKTLGGNDPKTLAYASGLDMPLSDQQIYDWYAEMAVSYGLTGGKLKVGLDQDADLRRLGMMDSALRKITPDPILLIDANEYWSPKQAIRKIREMERHFDLAWVEEPARRWDFLGLRRISEGVNAAVCAGENLDTLGDFLPYLHHRSADIIQVSAGMTGITGALQLADAAYSFELPVTLGNSPGHIHAHLAPALPNVMNMEIADPVPLDGIFTCDVRIENGFAIAGTLPGNGIQINYDALAKAALETIPPGAGPSPFGRRAGAGLYAVPPTTSEITEAAKPITN